VARRLLSSLCKGLTMLGIPRRYSHFVFAVIQSGMTCLVEAAIASFPMLATGHYIRNWLFSWLISWITILPVVLLGAPIIRSISLRLTRE
jgi:hypothetical protein